MSSINLRRIPLNLPKIDAFTFGESSLYCCDSTNNRLIVYSLNTFDCKDELSFVVFKFSTKVKSSIQKIILNEDETILCLVSDKSLHLVYLPKLFQSPSREILRCHLVEILRPSNEFSSENSLIIDFIWLSPLHFVIVYSNSSNQCYFYSIQSSKYDRIEPTKVIDTEIKSNKGKTPRMSNRKCLYQAPSIVKLNLLKQKQDDSVLLVIFALKSDGNMFSLEIDTSQLMNNKFSNELSFVGPIRILPSAPDNYGSDHCQSNIICLSNSSVPIILFVDNEHRINQCIYLNSSNGKSHLFTIDRIVLPKTKVNSTIQFIIVDRLNSDTYYVCDSLLNIYFIKINWIEQIKKEQQKISSTTVEYLLKFKDSIENVSFIQTNIIENNLVILTKSRTTEERELIFVNSDCLSKRSMTQTIGNSISSDETQQKMSSSNFVDRVKTNLQHTSSMNDKSKLSFHRNFQNLEDSISAQNRIETELKNRQKFFYDLRQIQILAIHELNDKLDLIKKEFQRLNQLYEKECSRRRFLSSKISEMLLPIESKSSILSTAEAFMYKQLENYEIKINSLEAKIKICKEFLSKEKLLNQNQEKCDQSSLECLHQFIEYYKSEINSMKEKLNNSKTD